VIEYSKERLHSQKLAFNEAQTRGIPVADPYGEVWYPVSNSMSIPVANNLTVIKTTHSMLVKSWAHQETFSYDSKLLHGYGG
jgi:hypothetical protein